MYIICTVTKFTCFERIFAIPHSQRRLTMDVVKRKQTLVSNNTPRKQFVFYISSLKTFFFNFYIQILNENRQTYFLLIYDIDCQLQWRESWKSVL